MSIIFDGESQPARPKVDYEKKFTSSGEGSGYSGGPNTGRRSFRLPLMCLKGLLGDGDSLSSISSSRSS